MIKHSQNAPYPIPRRISIGRHTTCIMHTAMSLVLVYAASDSVTAGCGFIEPNSDAPPLWPRFLPGMWKPRCEDEGLELFGDCESFDEEKSPNRENMLFFFGLTSSLSPTSTKYSSSVDSGQGFSKLLPLAAGEDGTREKRESSEVREGIVSV